MTRTTRIYLAACAALLAGGLTWRGGAAPQASPATPSSVVNLVVMLGLKASAPERWDGAARVSGGDLIATEGRHFSQTDEVTSNGAWRASTLEDRVPPYADLHYTEMRPGIAPEVLHRPVGVFLTIKPGGAARVSIETAQGNFDFALSDAGPDPKQFLGGRAS
ncbi:MAG: hypothetical protein ACREJ4_15580, partial [Candidatus Methylomirabilaceae bacterium]